MQPTSLRQCLSRDIFCYALHPVLTRILKSTLCKQVQLQREKLELNPVFSTAMQHGDHMTGYIRLVNFSQKAAPEMRHAIAQLQVLPCL